jgi:hypothetical protein
MTIPSSNPGPFHFGTEPEPEPERAEEDRKMTADERIAELERQLAEFQDAAGPPATDADEDAAGEDEAPRSIVGRPWELDRDAAGNPPPDATDPARGENA